MDLNNTLYILFGSRTGNAKSVAVLAHEYAQSLGYNSVLQDMQEMNFSELKDIHNLLVVVSTHGEGEPPVQAEGFYEFVHSDELKSLSAKYAVLGLGDSSYRYYCQTGKDIHNRFKQLGGKPLLEPESCDIDFEETAKNWVRNVIEEFSPLLRVMNPLKSGFVFELKNENSSHQAYRAELLEKRMLTTNESSKKVLHVSLSLANSGIDYLPGDALGVFGTNSRLFVDELLKTIGFDKAYPVKTKDGTRLLKDLLIHEYELTLLTPLVVNKYALIVNNNELNKLVSNEALLNDFVKEHDILDLIFKYPGEISVEEFLSILRKLNHRLYSVASSSKLVGEKADITVKIIENLNGTRTRNGVCSSFLWHRLDVGDKVPVTLETISKFRLPDNDNQPIIMIAAGTGIAPFLGFLQERMVRKATGRNWLIFGERNRKSDFLYEKELREFQGSGLLTRINTIFSRDQKEKVYVSSIIQKEASTIINWIKEGAIIYVCGSKDRLAYSVRESLIQIFKEENNVNETEAANRLEDLKNTKQYQEEVY